MLYFWILFNLFALGMLVLDLRVFHHAGRTVRPREALERSALWVGLAGAFAVLLFFWQGHQAALEFVAGYVLELSLSVDNLFVFLVIFRYFAVPEEQQHGVLFWGIVGALVLRGAFILAGVGLIEHFHWVLYVFGVMLIVSGIKFMRADHQVDPKKNPLVKVLRRWLPMTDSYQGGKFLVRGWRGNPGLFATPLLLVLAIIETTDVLFAVDSIPAVLAITLNAFIVYTSNVFAIMGLRSMYFAVAELMKIFRHLHYGLAGVLILVGLKMLTADRYPVPTLTTLGVVLAVLLVSVVVSVVFPAKNAE
ncbi:MAG TPA: TerC/Alx family metal homeostasis membrane protein [Candidatus Sulfotelmatobacter sp.]|nr:TerC/Alx family metal homeostasis membrane protein [Candidatus Sulfotelmatobacter sp.]